MSALRRNGVAVSALREHRPSKQHISSFECSLHLRWKLGLTLSGRAWNASGSAMLRLFALIMICVLGVSHGAASVAAPHAAVGVHSHEHEDDHPSAGESVDAQHVDESADNDGNDSFPDDQNDVAHVHPVADMVPMFAGVPAQRLAKSGHLRPRPPGALVSTEPSPLLEPPSA